MKAPVDRLRDLPAIAIVSVTTMLLAWFLLPPRWLTNDDVSMSMVAHGYGVAVPGSPPALMFSNVVWGYIVRGIPSWGGLLGYSQATLLVLLLSCIAAVYGLRRLGAGWWVCALLAVLVWSRPILFPQFTFNAGLLTATSVVLACVHARHGGRWTLVFASVFAFFGFLIRSQEFLLVLIVAAPLLPWRALVSQKISRWAVLTVGACIAASVTFDHDVYQRAEWRDFNALNPVRARFTDFQANEALLARPDVLRRHGYSVNDAELIQYWFFVDPGIANPPKLAAMLAEVAPLWKQEHSAVNALAGIKAFAHRSLWVLMVAALVGLILFPSRRLFTAWALFVGGMLALGILGRPGIVHVYLPPLAFLAMAPLLLPSDRTPRRMGIFLTALALAASANAFFAVSDSRALAASDPLTRERTREFPQTPVFVWGDSFPFEANYPVLGASPEAMKYQFFGLGVSTLAPFSVAYAETGAGRGLVERLIGEDGIPLLAHPILVEHLAIYCREHYAGTIQQVAPRNDNALGLAQVRCVRSTLASLPRLSR